MNVLFLTLSNMENIHNRGIYTDLIREMADRKINMYVVSPRERKTNLSTELTIMGNIQLLKVRTGNITKTNRIEKGISTLTIEKRFLRAIKNNFSNIRFDMIIYSTPPITFGKIIEYFKNEHNSKTYLILKDIFPQNAVDIDLMKKGSLIWRYFRNKEERLYSISDKIGCMSQGNLDYIYKNNNITKEKLEIFPNSIKPTTQKNKSSSNDKLFKIYNVPKEKTLFVYGGNLGKPQGIDFLLEVIGEFEQVNNGYLMIVGSGTEYNRIDNYIKKHKPKCVKLLKKLPKREYDQILNITDVGLIFLDKRFTIPNIPSRLTAYMEHSIPILAATDKNTDLKDVLQKSNSGNWCESGNIEDFLNLANKLSNNKVTREDMGKNGRRFLEENYDVTKTVNVLLKHLKTEMKTYV